MKAAAKRKTERKADGRSPQTVKTQSINEDLRRLAEELVKWIRLEPTCIKCDCTEDNACQGGCSWTFLNKKTNEGLCSACFTVLAAREGV